MPLTSVIFWNPFLKILEILVPTSFKVRKLDFWLLYSKPSRASCIIMTRFIIYLENHLSSIWMSRYEMKLCKAELYKMVGRLTIGGGLVILTSRNNRDGKGVFY